MTKEEEDYFDNYFDLFLTTGWKQFISEIQDSIDGYRILDIKDDKHLYSVQGELQMLTRMANFELAIRNAYDHTQEVENAEEV